jgi:hypothetical protein
MAKPASCGVTIGMNPFCRAMSRRRARQAGIVKPASCPRCDTRSRRIFWRLVGNEAAHDVEAAVTADDARDILEFTEALLMYVFTLDTKFRSFAERRKRRAGGSSAPAAQQGDAPDGASRRG